VGKNNFSSLSTSKEKHVIKQESFKKQQKIDDGSQPKIEPTP